MKKLSVLFGVFALLVAEFVFANATVHSLTGTATVALGATPGRALRQGDTVKEGETVATGRGSSIVLRFEDGQIAALSAESRMTVTTYKYDAKERKGNILLTLVNGGMRAVTGLLGRSSPQQVSYRAATATIGIRGTDVTILMGELGNVVVTVTDGVIAFKYGDQQEITIRAGQGVDARLNVAVFVEAVTTITNRLQQTPQGQLILQNLNQLGGLAGVIFGTAILDLIGIEQVTIPTPSSLGGTSTGGGTSSPSQPGR
jgi:hypothetical protein